MSDLAAGQGQVVKNHGWRVTFAGMGINLALGVLYSWSIISGAIESSGWGWTAAQRSLPYSVACLVFCIIMVPAGRMQDKIGPRVVATIGGLLVGLGMILSGFGNTVALYVVGFGLLVGAGLGFGYASATPPAVKWFPPAKTGLIAGLVVSGFGLASVYTAPLCKWLSADYGLKTMMIVLGVSFFVIVGLLAQLLTPPPKGYVAPGTPPPKPADANGKVKKEDFTPAEMLKTGQFYLLWFMYACGAGAGLMIISCCKKIVSGAGVGVIAVMALAVGNGAGRVVAGMLSDKLGRKVTLFLFLLLQAVVILALSIASAKTQPSAIVLVTLAALVGANYGSNLSLFPSITKDFFGLKNFGMNYGLVFTAWGFGGFILAQLAGKVYDKTQTYTFAFYCSIAVLILAGIMTFLIKAPHHSIEA